MSAADLAQARRHFADELRMVGHLRDERVMQAFAAVPRERFCGPGPWRVLNMLEQAYWTTPDADPRWLYHNVLVALDEGRRLNTGEPSLWAHHFDGLGVREGERVLQIGTGGGYFTAILAELVGSQGRVLGLEVDHALAASAAANLGDWPQAEIRKVEGVAPVDGKFDVVIAFAGVTAPPEPWLGALAEGGRALIPLTAENWWGFLLRLELTPRGFAAARAGGIGIFHCEGGRTAEESAALGEALKDLAGLQSLRALRRDAHARDPSCWLHGEGWCLSKREFE